MPAIEWGAWQVSGTDQRAPCSTSIRSSSSSSTLPYLSEQTCKRKRGAHSSVRTYFVPSTSQYPRTAAPGASASSASTGWKDQWVGGWGAGPKHSHQGSCSRPGSARAQTPSKHLGLPVSFLIHICAGRPAKQASQTGQRVRARASSPPEHSLLYRINGSENEASEHSQHGMASRLFSPPHIRRCVCVCVRLPLGACISAPITRCSHQQSSTEPGKCVADRGGWKRAK